MPNVVVPNWNHFANPAANGWSDTHYWAPFWKVSRAMKKAGWKYQASSDAVSMDTSGNPANDKWGFAAGSVQAGAATSFTLGAPNTTATGGRALVTITGAVFTSNSPGNYLTVAGATNSTNNGTWVITKYVSATQVYIENPTAIAETTPGTATWAESSALNDVMPTAIANNAGNTNRNAWLVLQGPSTMWLPIGNNVPTGSFVRGENIVQTSTGATGEILGVVTDPGGLGRGYAVVMPRLSGTGSGPRGWGQNTITGSISGATVSVTATAVEFVREVVMAKGDWDGGFFYYQCINPVTEGTPGPYAGRFSTMAATLSQCTPTSWPGSATASGTPPSANGFPQCGTMVFFGQGGSQNNLNGGYYMGGDQTLGNVQIICVNCIEDDQISADGTIQLYMAQVNQPVGSHQGWTFMRLDNTEEGDVDPYAFYLCSYNQTLTRTTKYPTNGVSDMLNSGTYSGYYASIYDGNISGGVGWVWFRRRGWNQASPTDASNWCRGTSYLPGSAQGGQPFWYQTVQNIGLLAMDCMACSFVRTAVRETIYVMSPLSFGSGPSLKGSARWWFLSVGGYGYDTYENKTWVRFGNQPVGLVAGPWDGVSNPSAF